MCVWGGVYAGEGIGVGIASCAVTEIQAENDAAIFIMWHPGSPWGSSPFPASQPDGVKPGAVPVVGG